MKLGGGGYGPCPSKMKQKWHPHFPPPTYEFAQGTLSSYTSDTEFEDEETEHTALISEEKAATGNVKLSVLVAYCRACTWTMSEIIVILYVLAPGAAIASNFWLAKWSTAQADEQAFVMNETNIFQPQTFCDGVNKSDV